MWLVFWIFIDLVYFTIKSITAYPKYLKVKKKSILTTGTVIDLKDIKYEYKDNKKIKAVSKTYIYNLEINIEGQKRIVKYSEYVSGNGLSSILKGASLEVFYNSSDNTVINAAQLKKTIWKYPLYTVIIAVVIVISGIIASKI